MLEVNIEKIKEKIDEMGLKRKYVSEQVGVTESRFSLILSGKRKMEAGEYANICKALNVPMSEFLEAEADRRRA